MKMKMHGMKNWKNWRASFCVPTIVPTWLLAHVRFQILALNYTVPFMKGQDSIQIYSLENRTRDTILQNKLAEVARGAPPIIFQQ